MQTKSVNNALEWFANDPILSRNDWISYSDAGVLQAINDGWQMYKGNTPVGFDRGGGAIAYGGAGWSAFFSEYALRQQKKGTMSLNSVIGLRLNAEQQGVTYATNLSGAKQRMAQLSEVDQQQSYVFVWGADRYREIASGLRQSVMSPEVMLGFSMSSPSSALVVTKATDPRTSWEYLSILGQGARPIAWTLFGFTQQTRYPFPGPR